MAVGGWTPLSKSWIRRLTDRSRTRPSRPDSGVDGHNDVEVQYTFHRYIWTRRRCSVVLLVGFQPLHVTHAQIHTLYIHKVRYKVSFVWEPSPKFRRPISTKLLIMLSRLTGSVYLLSQFVTRRDNTCGQHVRPARGRSRCRDSVIYTRCILLSNFCCRVLKRVCNVSSQKFTWVTVTVVTVWNWRLMSGRVWTIEKILYKIISQDILSGA